MHGKVSSSRHATARRAQISSRLRTKHHRRRALGRRIPDGVQRHVTLMTNKPNPDCRTDDEAPLLGMLVTPLSALIRSPEPMPIRQYLSVSRARRSGGCFADRAHRSPSYGSPHLPTADLAAQTPGGSGRRSRPGRIQSHRDCTGRCAPRAGATASRLRTHCTSLRTDTSGPRAGTPCRTSGTCTPAAARTRPCRCR